MNGVNVCMGFTWLNDTFLIIVLELYAFMTVVLVVNELTSRLKYSAYFVK